MPATVEAPPRVRVARERCLARRHLRGEPRRVALTLQGEPEDRMPARGEGAPGRRQWCRGACAGQRAPGRRGPALVDAGRRLFAGRDGRIALTLVLAVTATLEASLNTPETQPSSRSATRRGTARRRSSSTSSRCCRSWLRPRSRSWPRRARRSSTPSILGRARSAADDHRARRAALHGLPPRDRGAAAGRERRSCCRSSSTRWRRSTAATPGSRAPGRCSSPPRRCSSASRGASAPRRSRRSTRRRRRWPRACASRPRWRSAPASPASCTTSSRTISR